MRWTILSFVLVLSTGMHAQDTIIPLWSDVIPNQLKSAEKERRVNTDYSAIFNVQTPTIEGYLPSKRSATGQAVLIFPGGSYNELVFGWEGLDVAKALSAKGIAAFVVKYRLPVSKSLVDQQDVPLQDAQRAIRIVKEKANELGIDPNKIGIMGFSAGGHAASTLGTHFSEQVYEPMDELDTISARPAFMALIYPVITMTKPLTHLGSRTALLGDSNDEDLIRRFSNELNVTKDTPPVFLIHSVDDDIVPVENTLLFFNALKNNGVPVEMHIYPYGGHGYAIGRKDEHLKWWLDGFLRWLNDYF
ncbi:alpha/beta hydrolase [Flagellimonas pelagia]|uniref:Alpha/beta hydrolase n=1 Tax=Flagellimonas pelagia TaxID=2306998 RepID=A0A3A1NF56_9FLAO|nr:alpha/beta hydrolase [Allomuricauda maritima]RIV43482.1 alpha/beta hydrolase [Allomuricauda maritima]TXJ92759.1 alpha/beta hydrolase [Allomuricauda maritima]